MSMDEAESYFGIEDEGYSVPLTAVHQAVDVMRENVDKVLELDQRLLHADSRALAMQLGAGKFGDRAGRLRRKSWWRNLKMAMVMGVVVGAAVVIVLLLLVRLADDVTPSSDAAPTTPAT